MRSRSVHGGPWRCHSVTVDWLDPGGGPQGSLALGSFVPVALFKVISLVDELIQQVVACPR